MVKIERSTGRSSTAQQSNALCHGCIEVIIKLLIHNRAVLQAVLALAAKAKEARKAV